MIRSVLIDSLFVTNQPGRDFYKHKASSLQMQFKTQTPTLGFTSAYNLWPLTFECLVMSLNGPEIELHSQMFLFDGKYLNVLVVTL